MNKEEKICPVERAGMLESKIRRWLQNPHKILKPYIRPGMTTLDMGCGPGFFTLEMAKLTGSSGKVYAVDLQQGMLELLKNKIAQISAANNVVLHKCTENSIGVPDKLDFILAFYMVHEIKDKDNFFKEASELLKPNGLFLLIEPVFHVTAGDFAAMISKAESVGLVRIKKPNLFLSRAAVFKKDNRKNKYSV